MSLKDFFESDIILPMVFAILGIVALITVIAVFLKVYSTNQKNANSPLLTQNAIVVEKRLMFDKNPNAGYFIVFEFENRERTRLFVDTRNAGLIAEKDFGKLTFQGTKFIKFERKMGNESANNI